MELISSSWTGGMMALLLPFLHVTQMVNLQVTLSNTEKFSILHIFQFSQVLTMMDATLDGRLMHVERAMILNLSCTMTFTRKLFVLCCK